MTSAEQANVVCSQVSLVRIRASQLPPRYSQFASGKALSVHNSTRRLGAPCCGPRMSLPRLRGQRPLRPPSTNRRRQALDILAAERAPVPLSTQQTSEGRGGCARGRVPSCLKLGPVASAEDARLGARPWRFRFASLALGQGARSERRPRSEGLAARRWRFSSVSSTLVSGMALG